MEISTFELLFNNLSPTPPDGSSETDRVIQGYFLTLTNLEDRALRYAVDFVIQSIVEPSGPGEPPPFVPPGTPFLRSLAYRTIVVYDVPRVNNTFGTLLGGFSDSVFRPSLGPLLVPAGATALLVVVPNAFGVPGLLPISTPAFEVRGFVRLRLPAVFSDSNPGVLVPQSSEPVRVLVTPQQRGTYFSASGEVTGQTQASLPISSGAGLNLIHPQPVEAFFVAEEEPDGLTHRMSNELDELDASHKTRIALDLLSQVERSKGNLQSLNELLARADVPLIVSPRE